jgi:hypothetical protein
MQTIYVDGGTFIVRSPSGAEKFNASKYYMRYGAYGATFPVCVGATMYVAYSSFNFGDYNPHNRYAQLRYSLAGYIMQTTMDPNGGGCATIPFDASYYPVKIV